MTALRGLKIEALNKYYGSYHAVKGIDLHVAEGEFAVLVGPSGCGKSTLLRTIAGLEAMSSGNITLNDRVIGNAEPKDRNIAMVFQSYALYPYLTVYDNIAFGLRARKVAESEVAARVADAAKTLHLDMVLKRFPRELSGGQRQRVAIGRAIVRDAELYLFDEPLSNLDAKLRDGMREELKRLHQSIGKTFVYVTHDQIEAMTLADRIVLLNDGNIEQQGGPLDLFERPATQFVAAFLGSPTMNMLPVALGSDGASLDCGEGKSVAFGGSHGLARLEKGKQYLLGIRPEHFQVSTSGHDLPVEIEIVQPTGSRSLASFRIGETSMIAELDARTTIRSGQTIALAIAMDRTIILDPVTGKVISYGSDRPSALQAQG